MSGPDYETERELDELDEGDPEPDTCPDCGEPFSQFNPCIDGGGCDDGGDE